MKKGSKILVTVIAVIVYFVLFGIIVAMREEAGHSTPGLFGLIMTAAIIGALVAVWKKDKNSDSNDLTRHL